MKDYDRIYTNVVNARKIGPSSLANLEESVEVDIGGVIYTIWNKEIPNEELKAIADAVNIAQDGILKVISEFQDNLNLIKNINSDMNIINKINHKE